MKANASQHSDNIGYSPAESTTDQIVALQRTLEAYFRDYYQSGTSQRPIRDGAKAFLTGMMAHWERTKARRLAQTETHLRLHLGCGDTYLDGWCNVDLARPGRKLDLSWDLRRGLPFPDASVEAIFSEHLFEHIPLPGAFSLLQECRRALMRNGVMRIGVPDLGRYIDSYSGRDEIIDEVRPGRPSRALVLNEIFYFYGHRTIYDYETLALLLRAAGFREAEQSTYGEGLIQPHVDSARRRAETLYIEAMAE